MIGTLLARPPAARRDILLERVKRRLIAPQSAQAGHQQSDHHQRSNTEGGPNEGGVTTHGKERRHRR